MPKKVTLVVPSGSVALRKESVDRNAKIMSVSNGLKVALRKESVDRNNIELASITVRTTSLSARRAWIEISGHRHFEFFRAVALRKESVDRNRLVVGSLSMIGGSLSARRAWIEIQPFWPSY